MANGNVPFVRNPFNYDMEEVSEETGLKCEDESLATQADRDEVDINTIVRRFGVTGQLPADIRAPQFEDFEGIHDFKSALDQVRSASEAFMAMPAEVRSRFRNDPQEFLAFTSNADNYEELNKLGLIHPDAARRRQEAADALIAGTNPPAAPAVPTAPVAVPSTPLT